MGPPFHGVGLVVPVFTGPHCIWPQFRLREPVAREEGLPAPAEKERRRVTVSAAEPEVVDIISLASDDPCAEQ